MRWRCHLNVESVSETHVTVRCSGTPWENLYPIPRAMLTDELNRMAEPGYIFHAKADINCDTASDFGEFECDGRTLAEQKEARRLFAEQYGLDSFLRTADTDG